MLLTAARRARPGFTLVELMVAAAVCVLIMAILAGAFSLGIDTVRHMKSSGDMMDQLRGAGTALKADLAATHLLDQQGNPVPLSKIRADNTKIKDNGTGVTPRYAFETGHEFKYPINGFMRICSPTITYPTGNPTDADGLNAGTGIATTHYLHFTSVLKGNSDDEYFRATVPSGTGQAYHSLAAEIAWFLEPMPSLGSGPTLHRLIRRQRLCALSDTDRRDRPWPNNPDEAVISIRRPNDTTAYLATLGELTNPSNRLGGTKWTSKTTQVGAAYAFDGKTPQDDILAPMASRPGEDTVLSNVISFEVQVHWTPSSFSQKDDALLPYGPSKGPPPAVPNRFPDDFDSSKSKTDHPFDTLPVVQSSWNDLAGLANTHTYDSWTGDLDWITNYNPTTPDAKRPPLVITVRAVQVRIRIWDPKMQTARQITFVQDL